MTPPVSTPEWPLYTVITIPDPVLKARAQEVGAITDSTRTQMDRMLATMYAAPGIGLAANQVGILQRVIVMDIDWRKDGSGKNPICMINPEIIWESDEISIMEEGCLSIPDVRAEVERPASVRVRYIDEHNQGREMLAEGLLSHCVQHEIDHLDGVLFIDHLSSLKRNMVLRRFKKLQRQSES